MALRSRNGKYINEKLIHVKKKLERLEKQGAGEQLSVAATVPPLPSLAEFPEEEGDKELDLEQERE